MKIKKSVKKMWFMINILFTVIYLVWRMFFTIPIEYGAISVIAGISLLVVEVLGMAEALVHYNNMYSVESYPLPEVRRERFPHVDIFIATYSEETSLLYKTVNGCLHMDYPDKSKVHIYLCDDNRRPEMRALAGKMGIHYLEREDNKGAKAGNLNHVLENSHSPFIVTFDADMIPKHDFLLKTIPYFVDNDTKNYGKSETEKIKLGFVQSPQSFYNPDLFQFNLFSEGRIPNEQDYFYKDIQVARSRSNSVIYGGSNTVIRREALEAVGGFYTGAITEDFATGILMEKKGFVSLGIGEVLASGMSPGSIKSLIQQRVRWARGVIATGRKMHIYTSKELSFAQKMDYWASVWYWYAPFKRLIYIMSPIMYATFGFMVFKCTLPQVLAFWLPMYVSSNISLRMLSGNIRNTKWTGIYETILFPFLFLPILLESFGITLKKFKVTEKEEQKNKKEKNTLYLIPFLILSVLSVIGICRCILLMFDSGSFTPVVVLFWLCNNLFFLVMAMLFTEGRIPYRKSERVTVGIPCTVRYEGEELLTRTRDISETGISVLFNTPYHFKKDSLVEILLTWKGYQAKLRARLVFVTEKGNQWNYSMEIMDYGDTYDDYLQIIYDRTPDLPAEIKKDAGSFEDLKLNTKKRVVAPYFGKRKSPRIRLNRKVPYVGMKNPIEAENGKEAELLDFSYRYVTLTNTEEIEEVVLILSEKLRLVCRFKTELRSRGRLYEITNIEDIMENKETYHELRTWLTVNRRADRNTKNEKHWSKKEFNESDLV